jgi:alanine dehydrogenase
MIIGVPKEIKNQEYRVGLTPNQTQSLVMQGHQVIVESSAGIGIGMSDEDYQLSGATIMSASDVFNNAELVVKVKEPQANEIAMLRPGQLLFTYLHLAPDVEQTNLLITSGVTAIAYETVKNSHGALPLLAPMSEVAGRLSIQAGAHYLEKTQGGSGSLISGIPGVQASQVLILGAGIVGTNAMQLAIGLGARVTIVDKNLQRLRELDQVYGNRIQTLFADEGTLAKLYTQADLVIGAVLIPGGSAPKLLRHEHLKLMRQGSVVVDVAIDQGGCFETSKSTCHDEPTYELDGIIHYCVANMPGAVPKTSTFGLTNATFPYIEMLANHGFQDAIQKSGALREGVSVYEHYLTCPAVSHSQQRPYKEIGSFL